MQNLFYNISQVLGITIIHSLWQGLIVYMVLRLLIQFGPNISSAIKYKGAFAALTIMAIWFANTLLTEFNNYNWLTTLPAHSALPITALLPFAGGGHRLTPVIDNYSVIIAAYLPYITVIYLAGLAFNTLKISLAWNNIYRIRQHIKPSGFQRQVSGLSRKLNISKQVQAAFSQYIDVPCITGFFKPIILLPFSLGTYLNAEEVEAILVHELAHIRRNDYIANIIQQAIGILLFFNPFSLLINRIINQERENCCDDMVVETTGSPLIYAQALLKLEQNKLPVHQLALAATGKKYHLLNRIERIMKTNKTNVNIRPAIMLLALLTFSLSSLAWFNPKIEHGKLIIKNAPAVKKLIAELTAPAKTADTAATVHKPHKHIIFKYDTDLNKFKDFTDTIIRNKKYKIIVEDENGVKKEYNSLSDVPEKDRKDLIGKSADLQFRTDSNTTVKYDNFYSSDVWKKQMAEAQKLSETISKQFNTPEFKKKQKEMVAKSMASVNDPQFQKHLAEIQKKAMAVATAMAGNVNSPEFKKQMAELQKSAEKWGKYYDTPEGKKQLEDLQKSAEEMGKYYDSPEFKKQIEDIGKYYDSPEFKKQMEDIGKYYDSPEFQKQVEKMESDKAKLKNYFDKKTADQKALLKDFKKATKEKTEKKEKAEKTEKPEKNEQPEKAEKPDSSQVHEVKTAAKKPEMLLNNHNTLHFGIVITKPTSKNFSAIKDTIIEIPELTH